MKKPSSNSAFTLVELLMVMIVIAILAGLILGTAGYAQKKAARSRAESEIRAMEAALESYKADNGMYPVPTSTFNVAPSGSTNQGSSRALYQALTGDGNDALSGGSDKSTGKPGRQGKSFMEFNPSMLANLDSNKTPTATVYIQDPFGTSYGYYAPDPEGSPKKPIVQNPTFDLWSTAGSAGSGTTDMVKWIKNW